MIDLIGDIGAQHIPGMGLRNERRSMEKRVRGMFMKKKNKAVGPDGGCCNGGYYAYYVFYDRLPADAGKRGCGRKDMQKMLSRAMAYQDPKGSLEERLDVPDKFRVSVQGEDGRFNVSVDADIVMPDVNSIPIVRVEGRAFDRENVKKIRDLFFDDSKFYDPYALSEETKTELIETLSQLKQRKSELKQQGLKPLHPELDSDTESNAQSTTNSGGNNASDEAVSMSVYNPLDMVNESIAAIEKSSRMPWTKGSW